MTKRLTAVAFMLVCMAATPAYARHHHAHHFKPSHQISQSDPRPSAWCGWWLRQQLGVADKAFNLARNWLHFGSPAPRDCVNCIAVWPHHVGIVTGRPGPGSIILKSGNDNHAVRERERSSRGIIGYRWPSNKWASLW